MLCCIRPIVFGGGVLIWWYHLVTVPRAFPVDMAGIAVNVRIFLENPSIEIGVTAKGSQTKLGYLETDLLSQFTSRDSVECRGIPNEVRQLCGLLRSPHPPVRIMPLQLF